MRPPEGIKEWFEELEEEQHALLEEPGGMATKSRHYRVTFAIVASFLGVATWTVLMLLIDWTTAGRVVTAVVCAIDVASIWVMALAPHRFVSMFFGRKRKT